MTARPWYLDVEDGQIPAVRAAAHQYACWRQGINPTLDVDEIEPYLRGPYLASLRNGMMFMPAALRAAGALTEPYRGPFVLGRRRGWWWTDAAGVQHWTLLRGWARHRARRAAVR